MSDCEKIKIPRRKVCTGDLKHRIKVFTREMLEPEGDSVDFIEDMSEQAEVWAAIKTVRANQIFDGVAVGTGVTHIFYIRYAPGFTFEKWVEYRDERYDVVDVENLDERNEFHALRCLKRGETSAESNKS